MNAEVKTSSISGASVPAQAMLFPLDEIFPRDQYGKKGSHLQFLIALNQPLKTIQSYLDKHPELLNERDIRCYMLSPLTVCVISGRYKVAEMFLAKGADPTAVDKHGFSSLHHAAIRNDEEMENLLLKTNWVGLKTIRNCLGQTYQDIQKLFNHPLPKEDEVVFHFKNEKGVIVQGTAQQFKEITGKQFVRSSVFTRKSIYFHWMKGEFHLLPEQGTFNFSTHRVIVRAVVLNIVLSGSNLAKASKSIQHFLLDMDASFDRRKRGALFFMEPLPIRSPMDGPGK